MNFVNLIQGIYMRKRQPNCTYQCRGEGDDDYVFSTGIENIIRT